MKIVKFDSEKKFISHAVEFMAKVCKQKKTVVNIALSGGSTPKKIYEELAKQKKNSFKKINFYMVDERYVSPNQADSNYRMIFEALIKPLKNKIKGFYYFDTTKPIQQSLEQYQEIIEKLPPKYFDLIILGIGPDGHIASLFPGSKALTENKKLTAHTQTNQFAVKDRLTLTFPAILKSQKILVLLKGKEKEKVLLNLQNPKIKAKDFPAKKLLRHKDLTIYFWWTL